jgi:hypothetical protein
MTRRGRPPTNYTGFVFDKLIVTGIADTEANAFRCVMVDPSEDVVIPAAALTAWRNSTKSVTWRDATKIATRGTLKSRT